MKTKMFSVYPKQSSLFISGMMVLFVLVFLHNPGLAQKPVQSNNSEYSEKDTPPPPPEGSRRLVVKVFLQGYYNAETEEMRQAHDWPDGDPSPSPRWMHPVSDQITVRLHKYGNYSEVLQTSAVFLKVNGNTLEIPIFDHIQEKVWVSVKQRNHIETVYFEPLDLEGGELQEQTFFIDFTSEIEVDGEMRDPSYGENQHQFGDGMFGIYAGDVNQDGVVNISDRAIVNNNIAIGTVGYVVSDKNGDGVVNISDRALINNNLAIGAASLTP